MAVEVNEIMVVEVEEITVVEVDEIERIEAERREIEVERRKEMERLVPGMDDEDLKALLRVFDKQIHHVHIKPPVTIDANVNRLDLEPSPEEDFDIDTFRSNLERFYASFIIGIGRALVEVQRIRRWEEGGTRSIVTLVVYSVAWSSDLIISTFLLFISAIILSPDFRDFCFHAPNSQDSTSPAAVEGEATKWAKSLQDMVTSAGGQGGKVSEMVKEEINGVLVRDMQRKKETGEIDEDVNKKDMAIELYGKPAMRLIGGLADKYERIANALNPTFPFVSAPHHVRVVCLLVLPPLVLSTIVSEHVASRIFGLTFGMIIFGQPVTDRVIAELDREIPRWKERIILENNILSDVPTNCQLIIRILRDGEHKRQPIPPAEGEIEVPESESEEEEEADDFDDDGKMKKMKKTVDTAKTNMSSSLRSKMRRAWDKAGSRKEEGFALITGHKKVDFESKAESLLVKLDVSLESKPAKAILKRMPSAPDENSPDNPSRFYVHHDKHGPGHLIIHPPTVPSADDESFTPARVTFTTIRHVHASGNIAIESGSEPSKGHLTISINDIISIKKEGMSLPGRLLTSWVLDTDGAGGTGLEIMIVRRDVLADRESSGVTEGKVEVIKLSGIVSRNELFNRLLSLGEQRSEVR